MTTTYYSYHSPRTGTVHLSRNHRHTLCGWNIRAGWVEADGTHSKTCYVCKRIMAADLAVAVNVPPAPDTQEATTP